MATSQCAIRTSRDTDAIDATQVSGPQRFESSAPARTRGEMNGWRDGISSQGRNIDRCQAQLVGVLGGREIWMPSFFIRL